MGDEDHGVPLLGASSALQEKLRRRLHHGLTRLRGRLQFNPRVQSFSRTGGAEVEREALKGELLTGHELQKRSSYVSRQLLRSQPTHPHRSLLLLRQLRQLRLPTALHEGSKADAWKMPTAQDAYVSPVISARPHDASHLHLEGVPGGA